MVLVPLGFLHEEADGRRYQQNLTNRRYFIYIFIEARGQSNLATCHIEVAV